MAEEQGVSSSPDSIMGCHLGALTSGALFVKPAERSHSIDPLAGASDVFAAADLQ